MLGSDEVHEGDRSDAALEQCEDLGAGDAAAEPEALAGGADERAENDEGAVADDPGPAIGHRAVFPAGDRLGEERAEEAERQPEDAAAGNFAEIAEPGVEQGGPERSGLGGERKAAADTVFEDELGRTAD